MLDTSVHSVSRVIKSGFYTNCFRTLRLRASNFSPGMIFYAGILVLLATSGVISAILVGLLETWTVFYSTLIGNVLKIILGVILVRQVLGFGEAVLGYAMIQTSILLVGGCKIVQKIGLPIKPSLDTAKEVLRSGIVAIEIPIIASTKLCVIHLWILSNASISGNSPIKARSTAFLGLTALLATR